MQSKKINPVLRWWVTPKLPPEDIFARHNFISQWLTHPIKRRLARAYLKYLQKQTNLKVIGITGSTGKTTTTEILASILSRVGKTVWSAEGVDPVYNIPNTILRTTPDTKYLILEMSVEYVNEMDYYLWLAKPDVGIITNIAATHTQFLGDEKGVAHEKGKLVRGLSAGGVAVLNKKDKLVCSLKDGGVCKAVFFGDTANIYAKNIRLNPDLSTNFTLVINESTKSVHMKVLGSQFVSNALASAAAADSLGIGINQIVRGIELFKPPTHRLNIFRSKLHGIIFDDSYNSNPKAANESLDTFGIVSKGKKKIAVIGDMLELGKFEESAHRELGKKVGKMKFDCIIGVGNAARFMVDEVSNVCENKNCFLVADYLEALEIVKPVLDKNSALFVKGSRSIHLDKLVDALK